MAKQCTSYLKRRLASNPKVLLVVTALMSGLEIFFAVRGFISFDFSNYRYVLYEVCYLILLLMSLLSCFYLALTYKKAIKHCEDYYVLSTVFVTIAVLFAVTVSYLDLSNPTAINRTPIVFVTMILAIPSLCLINPLYYSVLVALATASLCTAVHLTTTDLVSSGTYINIVVASLLAIVCTFTLFQILSAYYKKSDKLDELSHVDQLTGLGNRRTFDEEVAALSKIQAYDYYFVFSDIDEFKKVNDQFGHAYGDEVLEKVGVLFKEEFGNYSYRYGGDEIVAITEKGPEEILKMLQRINEKLSSLDKGVKITMSSGVYKVEKGSRPEKGFIKADEALYKSKVHACGETHFYNAKDKI